MQTKYFSMRLTDRRKTAKHLARRRKNCQILTDGREKSRLLKNFCWMAKIVIVGRKSHHPMRPSSGKQSDARMMTRFTKGFLSCVRYHLRT